MKKQTTFLKFGTERVKEVFAFVYYVEKFTKCVHAPHPHAFTIIVDILNMPASVAQLDARPNWRPGGRGFNPHWGRQHSFVETDREIFSTVILSLPLIQEGQLSVSGERMCTILVNHLED